LPARFPVGACNLIARLNARDGLADREHITGHLMTGYKRQLDTIPIGAFAHEEIMKADAPGPYANEDLIVLRFRRSWEVLDPHYFGLAHTALDHRPHCFPH
jgi:hypothetical protein